MVVNFKGLTLLKDVRFEYIFTLLYTTDMKFLLIKVDVIYIYVIYTHIYPNK
jgi:hypothetical protein